MKAYIRFVVEMKNPGPLEQIIDEFQALLQECDIKCLRAGVAYSKVTWADLGRAADRASLKIADDPTVDGARTDPGETA